MGSILHRFNNIVIACTAAEVSFKTYLISSSDGLGLFCKMSAAVIIIPGVQKTTLQAMAFPENLPVAGEVRHRWGAMPSMVVISQPSA